MQRRVIAVWGLISVGMLAGCATVAGPGAEEPLTLESPASVGDPGDDPVANATADDWLENAVMPPGTVRSDSIRETAFATTGYSWWCSPMVERTGYWTLDGAGVVETANWLSAHPTADLMSPVVNPYDEELSGDVDAATIGNVPEPGSLEGIAYTVAKTRDGVAIRAEIGVMPEGAVCPTPEPGVTLGGPGQG